MSIHNHRHSGTENTITSGLRIYGGVDMREIFKKIILPLLKKSAGDLTEVHSLFWLLAANNEVKVGSKYFEADVTLLGFTIPHVGFLVVKYPNTLLEPQHSTQLPGVIGCNLIHLGCEEFGRVYGFKAFEEFHCPSNIHLVVFSQM